MAKQVEMNNPCDFCGVNVRFIARSKAEAARFKDAYIVCRAPECEQKHQERIQQVVKAALASNSLV